MHKHIMLLAILMGIFLAFGPAHSATIDGSGLGIWLIDGGTDSDTTVSPSVLHFTAPYELYYRLDQGSWNYALGSAVWPPATAVLGPFEGGSTIDFALDFDGSPGIQGTDLFSYNSSHAAITYDNLIGSSNSENPSISSDYYRNVYIGWIVPGSDPPEFYQFEILGATNTDGYHPQVVPIPGAVWLLGAGLVGIIGFRRRKP